MRRIDELAAPSVRRLIALRRDLHRHPELANQEKRTMGEIARLLSGLGAARVRRGVAGTGVSAEARGAANGPVVAVRVPIDAYPIQERSTVTYRSRVSGISHACGHDALAAMAVGAAELLLGARARWRGGVRFLFQPAEEGSGRPWEGAKLMLKEGALEDVRGIIGVHVDNALAVGTAGFSRDAVYAGLDALEISVKGRSAHGATPHHGVDAIHAAASLLLALRTVTKGRAGDADAAAFHVGTIRGGRAHNSVSDHAILGASLRTYSKEGRAAAWDGLRRICRRWVKSHGVAVGLSSKARLPPTVNSAPLAARLKPVLEAALGRSNVHALEPMPFSDDFGFLAERIPSFYFQIGSGGPGIRSGTHTERFDVDERVIPLGARLLAELALEALG